MLLEAGRHASGAAESLVRQLGCATRTCLCGPGGVLAQQAAAARAGTACPLLGRPLGHRAARLLCQHPAVLQRGRLPWGRGSGGCCALALQDAGDVVEEVCEELVHALVACRGETRTALGQPVCEGVLTAPGVPLMDTILPASISVHMTLPAPGVWTERSPPGTPATISLNATHPPNVLQHGQFLCSCHISHPWPQGGLTHRGTWHHSQCHGQVPLQTAGCHVAGAESPGARSSSSHARQSHPAFWHTQTLAPLCLGGPSHALWKKSSCPCWLAGNSPPPTPDGPWPPVVSWWCWKAGSLAGLPPPSF